MIPSENRRQQHLRKVSRKASFRKKSRPTSKKGASRIRDPNKGGGGNENRTKTLHQLVADQMSSSQSKRHVQTRPIIIRNNIKQVWPLTQLFYSAISNLDVPCYLLPPADCPQMVDVVDDSDPFWMLCQLSRVTV